MFTARLAEELGGFTSFDRSRFAGAVDCLLILAPSLLDESVPTGKRVETLRQIWARSSHLHEIPTMCLPDLSFESPRCLDMAMLLAILTEAGVPVGFYQDNLGTTCLAEDGGGGERSLRHFDTLQPIEEGRPWPRHEEESILEGLSVDIRRLSEDHLVAWVLGQLAGTLEMRSKSDLTAKHAAASRAVALDPDGHLGHCNLILPAYFLDADADAANSAYREALRTGPLCPLPDVSLSLIRMALQQFPEAGSLAEKGLELFGLPVNRPQSDKSTKRIAALHSMAGLAAEMRGDTALRDKHLAAAAEVNPNDVMCLCFTALSGGDVPDDVPRRLLTELRSGSVEFALRNVAAFTAAYLLTEEGRISEAEEIALEIGNDLGGEVYKAVLAFAQSKIDRGLAISKPVYASESPMRDFLTMAICGAAGELVCAGWEQLDEALEALELASTSSRSASAVECLRALLTAKAGLKRAGEICSERLLSGELEDSDRIALEDSQELIQSLADSFQEKVTAAGVCERDDSGADGT